MNFHINEIVLCFDETGRIPQNTEATIVNITPNFIFEKGDCQTMYDLELNMSMTILLQAGYCDNRAKARISEIKKLPPRNELGSWDDCVFKPAKIIAH